METTINTDTKAPIRPQAPSNWVVENIKHIPAGGKILDLACGSGRHTRYLLAQDFTVTALDINIDKVHDLDTNAHCTIVQADLESERWPLQEQYDAIIVCNYLHRALFPALVAALNNKGVLIYQTFMVGNEQYGKPSRKEFLLRENELREAFEKDLSIVAFSQGYTDQPKPAMTQQLCARKG